MGGVAVGANSKQTETPILVSKKILAVILFTLKYTNNYILFINIL